MQLSQFENKESEFVSASLGLLDFTSSLDVDSLEEADMQQKPKKKKTRGFKL